MTIKVTSDLVADNKGVTYNVTHTGNKKTHDTLKPDPKYRAEGPSKGMTRDVGK